MTTRTVFIGLDVHKATITVAVAEEGRDGEVRSYGTIENRSANVNALLKQLSKAGHQLHFCYEAGCCGYGLYRQITASGHLCTVVAPSMIPYKPGERVKTDCRDAIKLARLLRAGEVNAVWVPDAAHGCLLPLNVNMRGWEADDRATAFAAIEASILACRSKRFSHHAAWKGMASDGNGSPACSGNVSML